MRFPPARFPASTRSRHVKRIPLNFSNLSPLLPRVVAVVDFQSKFRDARKKNNVRIFESARNAAVPVSKGIVVLANVLVSP